MTWSLYSRILREHLIDHRSKMIIVIEASAEVRNGKFGGKVDANVGTSLFDFSDENSSFKFLSGSDARAKMVLKLNLGQASIL